MKNREAQSMTTQRLLQLLSRTALVVAFLLALTGVQGAVAQQTIYVSSTSGADAFDGATANIAGGSGPKATLAGALAIASADDTISIEAGVYNEPFGFAAADPSVAIVVTPAGGVTRATFTGSADINPGVGDVITISSGQVAVSGGNFDLVTGELVNNGAFTLSGGPVNLEVTGGSMSGSTAVYTGAVTAVYNLSVAGSSGAELPGNLQGGSLTIQDSKATTFGSALTAGSVTNNNSEDVTFSGALTVSGNVANAGGGSLTISGDLSVGGDLAQAASGSLTASGTTVVEGNITDSGVSSTFEAITSEGVITTNGGAAQTFNAGAVTFVHAGPATVITNGANATMTLASLTTSYVQDLVGNAADDSEVATIVNNGALTVSGAITETGYSDDDEEDVSVIAVDNNVRLTLETSATLSGDFDTTGGRTELGSTTLTLTTDGSVILANIDGAGSTVVVSGDVSVAGGDLEGNLTISGSPANAVTAALTVGGNFTNSGDGHINGDLDVEGNVTNSGDGNFNGGMTHAITGDLTNSGDGNLDGTVNVGGNYTQSGDGDIVGTVTVDGNMTVSGSSDAVGTFDVAGDATFSGTTNINQIGSDVDGAVTVSGSLTVAPPAPPAIVNDLTVGSASVTALGSLTVAPGATLNVEGDLNTSNGGAFAPNGTVAFNIAGGTTATFTPGPNTTMEHVSLSRTGAAGTATLALGQSFAINTSLTTYANTALSLGNYLVRATGNPTTVTIDGTVTTPAGQDGALAFENVGQTLEGLGDVSNILVNVGAANTMAVDAEVNFSGTLTLFTGGINVLAGGDMSPTGASAEVLRNAADPSTTIGGAGTFNGDDGTYNLTIYNDGAAVAGSEYAATGINTLSIEGTRTSYFTNLAATVGSISLDAGTLLAIGQETEATGTVTNDGVIDGAPLKLTGADKSHTNKGGITSNLVLLNTGITVTGNATIGAAKGAYLTSVTVGDGAVTAATGSATLSDIQQIDGQIDVDSDGSLSISIVADDNNGATGDGNEGRIDGPLFIVDGGSVTLNSDVEMHSDVFVGDVDGDGTSFNFNGYTVDMAVVGNVFITGSKADLGQTGTLKGSATFGVDTNRDGAVDAAATLPGLDVDADLDVFGNTKVDGTTDIDAGVRTFLAVLTLSGTVHIGDDIVGNYEILGTEVMVEGQRTIDGTLTINASSVSFDGDAVGGADVLTVTGLYTQTAGDVTLDGVDLILQGGVDYTAGALDATTDEMVVFEVGEGGTFDLNGGTLVVTNLEVSEDATIDGKAGTNEDHLHVRDYLLLHASLIAGNNSGAATPTGKITLGDNVGTLEIEAWAGNVIEMANDGTVAYGTDTVNITYTGVIGTGSELFAAVNTLTVDAGLDFESATTVQTLDLNAAGSTNADNVTIAAGGTVKVGIDGALAGDAYSVTDASDFTLVYDGATTTDETDWPLGYTPDLVVESDVELHDDRVTVDVTTDDGALDVDGNTLHIQGNTTTDDGPASITGGGKVVFNGTTAQTITGGLWNNGAEIEVDNAAGITLAGGDLNVTDNNTDDVCRPRDSDLLTLTDGVITTGSNNVILCHESTTNQGFTRTSGVIYGNAQATVDGFGFLATDRVEFPLGDADGNYRPYAVTFNTPNQLASTPVLVASYVDASPAGSNGLPIMATNLAGDDFNVGRYPEFHWRLDSSPTLSPSIDYDVEFRAAGYDAFAEEDIENTRAIRRVDGSEDNFWILAAPNAADNDNFAASATEPVAVARDAQGAVSADGVLFTFGLETNLSATDPAGLVLNAGNSEVVDLNAVFTGGGAARTYTVTGGDAAVATAAADDNADTFTVTGVAAGTTSWMVSVNDGFQSVDATVSVTVNAALAAAGGLVDVVVPGGAAPADVDASGDFSGGTGAYSYAVASSDAAVVAVTVSAAGVVTHTFGAAGTATITVTATDTEGDSVSSSFDVTVNGGIVAAGGLANEVLDAGDTADTDVSGEFSGGNGAATFTYAASSDSEANVTVTIDGATVTATGVSAYTMAAGAVTADAAAATITVTATDDQGVSATSTYTVEVNPVLGDVDGSGGPSPASASAALNTFLGLGDALTAKQQTAADYNADASITPYDAALIFDAFFNGKDEIVSNPNADITYGELLREATVITIPVQIAGDLNDVVSGSFVTTIDPAMATIVGVTSELGDGWMFNHVVAEDGTIKLAFAGNGSIDATGTVATIAIELSSANAQFNLGGEGATNNNATMSIDAVEVAELPETFALHGNYPNPFNPTTAINFDLPESADVEIHVIDMIGRQVMTLPATTIAAGANRTVQVNASQLASGPYFYRVIAKMESKTLVETGRMMLVK
jgi:hypothetical protein